MQSLKFKPSFLNTLLVSAENITGEKVTIETEFESADSFTYLLAGANQKFVGKIYRFERWPPPGKIDYIHGLLDKYGVNHEEMLYSTYNHPKFVFGWQLSKYIPASTVKVLKNEKDWNYPEYLTKMGQLFKNTHAIKMNYFGSLSDSTLRFKTFLMHLKAEVSKLDFSSGYGSNSNLKTINRAKSEILLLAEKLNFNESVLVHDDANTGNILWYKNFPLLIDWVDSLAAPPIRDMANLTFTKNKPILHLIEKGYGKKINSIELRLHQMVRLLRLVYFYFYEDENPEESNKMLQRLDLLLNQNKAFGE